MTSLRTASQVEIIFFCVRCVAGVTFDSIAVYLCHTPKKQITVTYGLNSLILQ